MKTSGFVNTNNIVIVVFLFLTACSGIFVPDPIDPRVPKYTEDGNEVAGALIDGEIWRLILEFDILHPKENPFFYAWNEEDSLSFCFSGGGVRITQYLNLCCPVRIFVHLMTY